MVLENSGLGLCSTLYLDDVNGCPSGGSSVKSVDKLLTHCATGIAGYLHISVISVSNTAIEADAGALEDEFAVELGSSNRHDHLEPVLLAVIIITYDLLDGLSASLESLAARVKFIPEILKGYHHI